MRRGLAALGWRVKEGEAGDTLVPPPSHSELVPVIIGELGGMEWKERRGAMIFLIWCRQCI